MHKPYNLILPLIAAGMLVFTFISITRNKTTPSRSPEFSPPTTTFKEQVAGVGIVKPASDIINVATNISGVLSEVFVQENQQVFINAPLFKIDEAQVQAKIKYAEATLKTKQLNYEDLKLHLSRFENIKDKRAISTDELLRRRFATQKAEAEVNEELENLNLLKVELNKLTVKSPINGTVLKINSHPGEYISSNTIPLVIGDLNRVLLTVSVDESDLYKIDKKANAIAMIRGQSHKKLNIKFVGLGPYAIPKTQLNSSPNEKIDTRVVELTYEFENSDVNVVPGQQADVFIETKKEN